MSAGVEMCVKLFQKESERVCARFVSGGGDVCVKLFQRERESVCVCVCACERERETNRIQFNEQQNISTSMSSL